MGFNRLWQSVGFLGEEHPDIHIWNLLVGFATTVIVNGLNLHISRSGSLSCQFSRFQDTVARDTKQSRVEEMGDVSRYI